MSALLTPSPPVQVWSNGDDVFLVQQPTDGGERQEIRITRDRIGGLIQVLQQTRDDA